MASCALIFRQVQVSPIDWLRQEHPERHINSKLFHLLRSGAAAAVLSLEFQGLPTGAKLARFGAVRFRMQIETAFCTGDRPIMMFLYSTQAGT
jgi:hypothetical protein